VRRRLPAIHIDDFGGIPKVFQFGFGNRLLPIRLRILTELWLGRGVVFGRGDRLFFKRLTAAAFATVNDMFLYGYFMMIIRQNQPDMPEESKHQLASKQVVNIRQFRKSMEEAAAAAIPHDTAIPA